MPLSALYEEIANDFRIDKTDLGSEATRTSEKLFVKYLRYYNDEKMRLEMLENQRKKLIIQKRDYYSGNASPEVYKEKPFNLKIKAQSVLDSYIESDEDVIKYEEKLIVQRQRVHVLENCMDEIKRRGFAIKAALEWHKFQSGL